MRHPARRHTIMPGSSICPENGPTSNRSSKSLSQLRHQLADEISHSSATHLSLDGFASELSLDSPSNDPTDSSNSNGSHNASNAGASTWPNELFRPRICEEEKVDTMISTDDTQTSQESICGRATACISSKRSGRKVDAENDKAQCQML